ncbi:sugar ABC transporter substrate-binding protein [Aeromicrobium terrae]|nr:sugar ABC transporter substrate-binding protein [Aeromicrobium terrae]
MIHTLSRRHTRKRMAGVIPALALMAVAASGCSTDSDGGSSDKAKGGELSSIQFVNPLPNYPAWKAIGQCMSDQADKRGVPFKQSGPTGSALDASTMIQQVQQAISNKVGAIVTFPASEGFGPVLKQAQAKGILTGTLFGTGGSDGGADVNAGPDFTAIGETIITAISKIPGQHVLGLVAQADTGLGKAWLDGVKAAVKKTDNVKVAGEVYTGDDAAKALPQVNALLTAHPDVTDIATHMGTVTPGAVAAIKAKKLVGKTFLVAGGHDNGGLESIQGGTSRLILLQDNCGLGKDMIDGIVDTAEGKPAASIPIHVAVVPQDEVQGYLDKGWS